jgi:hypothetical protein
MLWIVGYVSLAAFAGYIGEHFHVDIAEYHVPGLVVLSAIAFLCRDIADDFTPTHRMILTIVAGAGALLTFSHETVLILGIVFALAEIADLLILHLVAHRLGWLAGALAQNLTNATVEALALWVALDHADVVSLVTFAQWKVAFVLLVIVALAATYRRGHWRECSPHRF